VSSIATPIVVGPEEGRLIPRPDTGGALRIKLESPQAGGALTVYESSGPAGHTTGPGIHSHPGFDEMFYVVRGRYEFAIGGVTHIAGEGTFVYVPRGVFHSFRSMGEMQPRLLTICTPGGIEELFDQAVRGSGAPASIP